MKFISNQEAQEFEANVKIAKQIADRIKAIAQKNEITKTDRKQLLSLQSQLYEINNWFSKTAK